MNSKFVFINSRLSEQSSSPEDIEYFRSLSQKIENQNLTPDDLARLHLLVAQLTGTSDDIEQLNILQEKAANQTATPDDLDRLHLLTTQLAGQTTDNDGIMSIDANSYRAGGAGTADTYEQTGTYRQSGDYQQVNSYHAATEFCIENAAPYEDMRPENLYRVRASMMTVRHPSGKESAGLQISDDLILTSADLVDDKDTKYEIETLNGVMAQAKVVSINVKKNTALLRTSQKMYFRPLSLNLELPVVGQGGFMSLGLISGNDGENYLDTKGTIKGYRFSDEMGTQIITDTFVQSSSAGGTLIDEKGVITGLASKQQQYDDRGDLFLPIQDAINSVGLKVCGQSEPFVKAPSAVVKPISSAIEGYTGSKEPSVLAKGKRK